MHLLCDIQVYRLGELLVAILLLFLSFFLGSASCSISRSAAIQIGDRELELPYCIVTGTVYSKKIAPLPGLGVTILLAQM